jgi:hypothetical protein
MKTLIVLCYISITLVQCQQPRLVNVNALKGSAILANYGTKQPLCVRCTRLNLPRNVPSL